MKQINYGFVLKVWLLVVLCTTLTTVSIFGNGITPKKVNPSSQKPENPLVLILNFTLSDYNGFNVSCDGSTDGTIDLTPSNGTPPYIFIWSTGAITEDLSGLGAGTYTVTVTDLLGDIQIGSVTLTQPAPLNIVQDSLHVDSCGGVGDGGVFISVTGGVLNYSYAWSNGSVTEDIDGVVAGNYTVTVTDANLCTVTNSYTVNEVPSVQLSTTPVDVLCNGDATGSIDLIVLGGTPVHTYAWSNGGVTQDLSGLIAGTYTVTVSDGSGCTETTNAVITQPAAALGLSTSTTSVACFGGNSGSINLTVTGGTAGYTYNWSNGFTGEDPTGLIAGTYTVTVSDANLCSEITSAIVTQPAAAIGLSTTTAPVACF
ncbi:MAG: SprB repeat-containing protein, partial [Bacteroidia bacterium]